MSVSATLIFNACFFSFRQLAIFFAVVWGGSAVVFLFSDQFGIPLYSQPLALACFFLLFLINTLNVCFRHCRFWLLKALVSTIKFVFVFLFLFHTHAISCFSADPGCENQSNSQSTQTEEDKRGKRPDPSIVDNQTPAQSNKTKKKPSIISSNTELIPSFQD